MSAPSAARGRCRNRHRSLVALLGAVLALSCLLGASPSTAGSTGFDPGPVRLTTLEGVVRTLAVDPVADEAGGSVGIYRKFLVVGSRNYLLNGVRARSNTRVEVTGVVSGDAITATSITTKDAQLAAIPTSGTTRTLVMLVYWTQPDSVTHASAVNQFFSDTDGWYRDASYGALGQNGAVTHWMPIAGPSFDASGDPRCYGDFENLMTQAKHAAAARGFDVPSFDNYVLYFPNCAGDAAGYAGWAYVGAPGLWLNGYLDRRVTVHEQGHNYGLRHSHTYLCSGGGLADPCSFSEYGDPYDAMGSSNYVGHFNASQKTRLGWLGAGRTVDLSAGGSAVLAPMAADALSPHAAVISIPDSTRTYWIEYRQPIDFDSGLPSHGTDGLLVHASGEGSGSQDTGASLLDVRPSDGISASSATLQPGESWTSTDGVTISAGANSATGASVTVTVGPYPLVVDVSGTGSGTVTSIPPGISCGATCSAVYPAGTVVTLTATPAEGAVFSGWTGGCEGTAPTCSVPMVAAQSVTASFAIPAVTLYQEDSATFAGNWADGSCPCFSGGAVKWARAPGASATFSFTGSAVSFFSVRGPERGAFRVFLDGHFRTRISNFAPIRQNAVAVWSREFPVSGAHTLRIVVVGTSERPRVDVDAYVVTAIPEFRPPVDRHSPLA